MAKPNSGFFGVFEGGEGSGKSSAIQAIAEALASHYPKREIVVTREPGGSRLAEQIRKLLVMPRKEVMPTRAELLLFAAARASHVDVTIKPALARGAIVLSDRFSLSSEAYQGAGHGLDLIQLRELDAIARAGLTPDLTLILDIKPEIGLERSLKRGGDATHFETLNLAFHARVRASFQMAARTDAHTILLDAGRPMADVHQACLVAILQRLQQIERKA